MLFFTALFVLMTGYLVWFQAFKSREVINNSYNARIEAMENQVIRGSILASDGQVLATTKVDADGTEKRVYPFGCTFPMYWDTQNTERQGLRVSATFS